MADEIQLSNTLKNKNVNLKGNEYKVLNINDVNQTEVNNYSTVLIYNTSNLTSGVSFIRSIQKNYGTSNLPASSLFTYKGTLTSTATGSTTALYELLRGYLYRDDSNTSSPTISSIINSKTSNNSITGFRLIMLDKNIVADNIKPTSFRMSITPININNPTPIGLNFGNTSINDNGTTGVYASITNDGSLSGSLTGGVSSTSALHEFTVLMKIKPTIGGAPTQTLFHRRLGDKSLTSIGFNQSNNANDNKIVMYKYSDLNPQIIEVEAKGFLNGSSTTYGVTGVQSGNFYVSDSIVGPLNEIGLSGFITSSNVLSAMSGSVNSPTSSFVINVTNVGGGTIKVGYSDGGVYNSLPQANNTLLYILSSGTTNYNINSQSFVQQINGIDYFNSTTASITCILNYGNTVSFSSYNQQEMDSGDEATSYNYLNIYSGNNLQSSYINNIEQNILIPIKINIKRIMSGAQL